MTEPAIPAPAKNRKSRIKRIFVRLLYAFSIGLLLLALLCFIIAFSTDFRQWSINKLVSVANNFLLAEISINDIKFNRLRGVSIEGINIIVENDTLANIKQAIIDVSFESLFYSNTIKINHIELIEPNVKLLRSAKDSLWNYNKIVLPSEPTPPDNEPTTTIINVAKIIITNGKFKYWDSLASYPIDFAKFRPLQMNWCNLNLNADNAIVDLVQPQYAIDINELSGKEDNSLDVKKLSLHAKLSTDGIEANDCYAILQNDAIDSTKGVSNIHFDASMTNFNAFGQKSITDCIMKLDLTAENFNPIWIDNFAKIPIKLGKVKQFEIKTKGTLNDMFCENLSLNFYNSYLNLHNITLKHLTTPQKLSYQGTINSTMIKRSDLQNSLKSIDLSAVPDFVQAYIMDTKFFGTTDSVQADLDIRTGIGSVRGNVEFSFAKKTPTYSVNLETKALNIATITNNTALNSNINCNVNVVGSELDINKINANVALNFAHSKIKDFAINNTKINVDINGGDSLIINDFIVNFVDNDNNAVNINELDLQNIVYRSGNLIDNSYLHGSGIGKLQIAGGIGLQNIEKPFIDLTANLQGVQLNNILNDSMLPQSITSNIRLQSTGIDIYNTVAKANVNVSEINYKDKSVLPFNLTVDIDNDTSKSNNINLQANNIFGTMFNVNLNGHFTVPSFLFIFQRDMEALKDFYHNKINSVINRFRRNDVDTITYQAPIIRDFKMMPTDISIDLDVQNLDFLSFWLDSIDINQTNLSSNINYKTSRQGSILNVNSLKINTFDWNINNNKVIINDVSMKSLLNIPRVSIDTNITNIDELQQNDTTKRRRFKKQVNDFTIDISSQNTLQFNEIKLDSIITKLQYHDTSGIKLDINGRYNSLISGRLHGKAKWNERNLEMLLDTFRINYANNVWHNDSTINFRYGRRGFIIRKFDIIRDNKEHISLAGRLSNDTMTNIRVKVKHFNIKELNELVFREQPLPIEATLDSVSLVINGTLSQPIITSNVNVSHIKYENMAIGNFSANANYKNENISGVASIKSNVKLNNELFLLELQSIPLHLGLGTDKPLLITNKPLDISIKINELQASLFSPFIPSVSDINGKLRGALNIGGYLPDKYEYSGNVSFENLQFRIDPINMQYSAFGSVDMQTDLISFKNLRVKNSLSDLRNGELVANGKIELSQLELKNIDIEATTNAFQILSDRTESAMPWFFGKMIIATNDKPLRFYGTMLKPNLSGSVEILDADVKMPQILNETVVRREQKFNYISKDLIRITLSSTIDSTKLDSLNKLKSGNLPPAKSIVDLLNIDLSLKIKRFAISLELGGLGNIFARIGTKVPNTPLRYVKERTVEEAKIYGGELEVLDGSTVQIYRTMSAKGSITFPTARISRPTLNLTAEYKGRINSERSGIVNYSVFVNITGTAQNPEVILNYSVNGNMVTGDPQQIQMDAFNALTQGILRGYNDSESTGVFDEIGTMFVSQIASKTLTDLLLKTGIIQSANIKFDDDTFNSANVSISGMLSGVATWTLGGKIQDIASNYNLSIDIPININKELLNTIIFQINTSTDVNNSEFDRNAKNWEINLKFNGHW